LAISIHRPEAAQRLQGALSGAKNASFAGWVSGIISPPVVLLASSALLAGFIGQAATWRWLAFYLALAIGIPLLYLLTLYRRGLVSDLDVTRREERRRPMLFTLGCMAAAGVLLGLSDAPRLLVAWAAILWAQLALVTAITLRWKISVHSTAAASMATMFVILLGPAAMLGALPVGLVGWSRVRLHRHTPAQAVAGALLGGAITASLLTWMALG
jgi:membrane-associated phospholipid phosphatase